MGEVVDVRSNRFLQEMREHGDWKQACAGSNMSAEEIEQLCEANPKFDLAQVECQLEYLEELYAQQIESVITEARKTCAEALASMRETALASFRARHGG